MADRYNNNRALLNEAVEIMMQFDREENSKQAIAQLRKRLLAKGFALGRSENEYIEIEFLGHPLDSYIFFIHTRDRKHIKQFRPEELGKFFELDKDWYCVAY